MNKKFLSAILFGALMVSSTGTFVSCKDYDDDIDRIDNTLNDLKSQLAALQTKVDGGKYVTGAAVTTDGKGITFTFNEGEPVTVKLDVKDGQAGTPGKDGTVVTQDEKTGELLINNEKTGIFPAKDAAKAPVKMQDGHWFYLNDKGEYVDSNIPVSGLSAVGNDAEGWTLTVMGADGKAQVVKVPGLAYAITGMEVGKKTNLDIFNVEFNFTAANSAKADIKDAAAWTALTKKNVPADKTRLFRSSDVLGLRINPVSVAAEDLNLTLVDSKKNAVKDVELIASAYKEQLTVSSRSTAYGNGLYTLNMKNLEIANKTTANALVNVIKANDASKPTESPADKEVLYAVNANNAFLSNYIVTLEETTPKTLTKLTIKDVDATIGQSAEKQPKVDVNKEVEIKAEEDIALYDMYMTTDPEYIRKFVLSFNQEAHTFTVGDNPDVSSLKATFPLYVYTVDINGKLEKTIFTVEVSSLIDKPSEYGLIEHNVSSNPNMFSFDLATMQNGMSQELLDKWHMNINLNKTSYALYTDKDGKLGDEITKAEFDSGKLFNAMPVAKVDKDAKSEKDSHKATAIQVKVDNTKAKDADMKLNTKYWVVVTFKTNDNAELNKIQVPVMFTAPALAQSFEIEPSYQDKTTNAINAFFYFGNNAGGNGTLAKKIVEMNKYFKKSANVAVSLKTDDKLGSANKSSSAVAQFTDKTSGAKTAPTFVDTYLAFNNAAGNKSTTDKREYGYGETLTVIASSEYYVIKVSGTTTETWAYTKAAEKTYSFQIKLMSPIYEGKVTGIDGKSINVNANDLKNGAHITDDMIKGYDYNNNPYSIVASKKGTPETSLAWDDAQIDVIKVVEADHTPKLFTTVSQTAYTEASGDTPAKKGTIKLVAESVSNETTVDLTVTVKDIWGYEKPFNVPVNIKIQK